VAQGCTSRAASLPPVRGTHELKGVPGDWQLYAASA
jgi:hypothetical protein